MPTRTLDPVLHYLRRIEAESPNRPNSDRDLLLRFTHDGDESAFAGLLGRHGPMVLGVCRRVLRDRHEAEDAFQATFLLLVRKAGSLRQPERLGSWLHGVAYRIALKARSRAARQATADEGLGDIPARTSEEAVWRDLRTALDRAIDALPAKYRTAFVLCCLQGLTHRQAAQQLGCPEGTVATRLSRARQRLRNQLAKLGLGSAAGASVFALSPAGLSAAPSELLVVSTLRIATAFRFGPSTAVPAAVVALTKGIDKAMWMTKLRFLLLLLALTGGAGGALLALGAQDRPPARPAPVPPPPVVAEQPVPPPAPVPVFPAVEPAKEKAAPFRTDNFLVHAPTRRIARLVGEAAERLRKSQALLWLGKELPRWPAPCPLKVNLGAGRSGATSFAFNEGKVLRRAMNLEGPLDQILCNELPHEITHTVLADHFRAAIPRWADEGAAMQAEDEEQQQRFRARMRELAEQSRVLPLTKVFRMMSYPANLLAFYPESYSLTHFLLHRKDRKTFLAFVNEGVSDAGWDAAVKDHYGFTDVNALQKAWLARVTAGKKAQPAPTARPATGVKSPPPTVGRAWIDTKGRLVVRCPIRYYQPVTRYTYNAENHAAIPVTAYELNFYEGTCQNDLKNVTATDVAGKRIDAKTLVRRLQTETAVLIAPGGQAVDPYYLPVMREGTIILTLPGSPQPPTPPSPPAAPALPPAPIR